MKLHHIATAAVFACVGSAHALTPAQVDAARGAATLKEVFVSGASALRLSFAAYVQEICNAGQGGGANDFDVFFNAGATPGNNFRAYSCTLRVAQGNWPVGTPMLIHKRDQSGSAAGVGPVAIPTVLTRMDVTAASCGAAVGPTPSTDIQLQGYNCTGTVLTDTPVIGLSDVEPLRFLDAVNIATGVTSPTTAQLASIGGTTVPLAQGIFGVIVNKRLYAALQTAQGLPLGDAAANQPSLSTIFVRSMLTTGGSLVGGSGAGATLNKGWNLVTGVLGDATKSLNICRRAEGSGTQAASNLFFAQNNSAALGSALTPLGCTNTITNNSPIACGTLPVNSAASTNTYEASSSGELEGCFATAESVSTSTGVDVYALGTLGRENNPLANGGDKGYRFVKLDGVAPTVANAQIGAYPFVFEATLQWNPTYLATLGAFGTDVAAFAATLSGPAGMGKAATIAAADVDTQQGTMAIPATYTGPFVTQAPAVKNFSSSVARTSGNSRTPLRVVK